jgi:molybdopterin molybdotransferase
MDGYAVASGISADTVLPVHGYLAAGGETLTELPPGTAARILTGAPLPAGADCVVPQESAEAGDGGVRLLIEPQPGRHVRRRGSDVRAGDLVLRAGTRIGPAEIALLAALGVATVPVVRRPRVALLSTGDELVPAGNPLTPGLVYDANGPALRAAVVDAGGLPTVLAAADDDPATLRDRLREGLTADVLVTSAGVSAGDRDLVRQALRDAGATEVFWQVAIQPGRPAAFAVTPTCLVFCLPGNPVAALLTFELLVRPALRRLAGHRRALPPTRPAVLAEPVTPRSDRLTLFRVHVADGPGGLVATGAGPQQTVNLRTLAAADGVALIPTGSAELPAGTAVRVLPLRDDSEFWGGGDG